ATASVDAIASLEATASVDAIASVDATASLEATASVDAEAEAQFHKENKNKAAVILLSGVIGALVVSTLIFRGVDRTKYL
ncbi:MAG: hypothetical protein IJ493_03175, partial [Clostridia bacterium]|nr:hypothetical protein [Clostridia bacterium]